MSKFTSPTSRNKVWTRLAAWLGARAEAAGARLFTDDDARALQQGWQIAPIQHGLGRRYRDPRFDLWRACPACHGNGQWQGVPCRSCHATGRIMIAPATAPLRGGEGHGQDPLASAK